MGCMCAIYLRDFTHNGNLNIKCMVSHHIDLYIYLYTHTFVTTLSRDWMSERWNQRNCAFNILYRRTSCDFIGKTRVVGLRMDTHIIIALYEYEGEAFFAR